MSRFGKAILFCLGLMFLNHCSNGKAPNSASPNVAAPSINDVFGSPSLSAEPDQKNAVVLHKKALGKEILLQGSVALEKDYGSAVGNPTTYGLKSRIVMFEAHGDELAMLDADKEMQPGQEMTSHALITTFPIVKKEGDDIFFDFNEGMKNILLSWDWYASDDMGNIINPDMGLPIEASYLRDVKLGQSALTVIQTIAAADTSYGAKVMLPMEVTYYLTPYQKNPNYQPVNNPGFSLLGFFEANPRVEENFGTAFTWITRYDMTKPVTYSLSSAIPEKYRQAVKDGVLYWNKAFGKEVVKVDDAPQGMTPPDFEHNIIQWVTAFRPSAYADAQIDPKTGEILHTQIFIQSGWGDAFRYYYLPRLARKLNSKEKSPLETNPEEKKSEEKKPTFLTAKQLQSTRLCELNLEEAFSKFYAHRDSIANLPTERIDALTLDIIRSVVAHEVGHTLGLRHNFAASLTNEWDAAKEASIGRTLMQEGKLPEKAETAYASVMDYPNDIGDILIGEIIANPKSEALPYDHYAIQWGYFGTDKAPQSTGLPFCTDSQAFLFGDCMRWDSGRHILERVSYEASEGLEKIPWLLSEVYLAAKAGADPQFRRPVNAATPDFFYLAKSVLFPWLDLMDLMTGQIPFLAGDSLHWINQETEQAGGIKKILQLIDPDSFQKTTSGFSSELNKILKSDLFTKEISLFEGGKVSFSKQEIDFIRNQSQNLFKKSEDAIVYYIALIFMFRSPAMIDHIEDMEAAVAHWDDYVISAGDAKSFRYSAETRLMTAQALHAQGPLPGWLAQYLPPIAEKLRQKLEAKFGMPIDKIKPENFPRRDQAEVAEELNIYYTLGGQQGKPTEPVGRPYD